MKGPIPAKYCFENVTNIPFQYFPCYTSALPVSLARVGNLAEILSWKHFSACEYNDHFSTFIFPFSLQTSSLDDGDIQFPSISVCRTRMYDILPNKLLV